MIGLNFEQTGFHRRRSPQAPQGTGQSQYKFALDSRLSVIIGDHCCFERFVVFSVFQCTNHGCGSEAMTDSITP